jgi:hypothetical protein
MRNRKRLFLLLAPLALLPSCVKMTHQLDQSKPLEINVNVRLQIQRELDEFFAYQTPATQPATQPVAAGGQS